MNKICINAKNYKLTEGQEYEILQEEDNYVRIINDSGKNVRYDSSLFEESEELIPAEAIPERTEQDCIDSISYNGGTLSYTDIQEEVKTIDVNLNLRSNNEFSCGINRIEGINSLCDLLENEEFVDTEEDDFIELKKQLFKTVFSHFANRPARGMWMCSTNIAENNEDYHELISEMSTHDSGWFVNPNSGNQIKLWYGIINQQ